MVIEFGARPECGRQRRCVELQDLTTSDFQELSGEQYHERSVPKLAFVHQPPVPAICVDGVQREPAEIR
jgi:hypothetical protein